MLVGGMAFKPGPDTRLPLTFVGPRRKVQMETTDPFPFFSHCLALFYSVKGLMCMIWTPRSHGPNEEPCVGSKNGHWSRNSGPRYLV